MRDQFEGHLEVGKIGLIALKDHDFRKIPPKSFGPVKYHRKLQTLPQISIPSHFPLTRRHAVILPPFPRPTAFFLLSLVLREPRREAIKKNPRRERGRLQLLPGFPRYSSFPSPPSFPQPLLPYCGAAVALGDAVALAVEPEPSASPPLTGCRN